MLQHERIEIPADEVDEYFGSKENILNQAIEACNKNIKAMKAIKSINGTGSKETDYSLIRHNPLTFDSTEE